MKEIKYEKDNSLCLTECPYKVGPRVSSVACQVCKFFRSDDEKKKIVECSFEDSLQEPVEAVEHPSHYNQGGIECIDAILAARGSEATKEFCICNAMKYLWRLGHKDDAVQEAKKAKWYLDKYIELYEQGNKTN